MAAMGTTAEQMYIITATNNSLTQEDMRKRSLFEARMFLGLFNFRQAALRRESQSDATAYRG